MTRDAMLAFLEQHRAHLTDADEREVLERSAVSTDVADLALRTCSCGVRVDGFYAYLDHLKDVVSPLS